MTIAVDLGRKATKQTNKQNYHNLSVNELIFDIDPLKCLSFKQIFLNLTMGKNVMVIGTRGDPNSYL